MAALVVTCRQRAAGPRRHHCSAWHADLVESYRLARAAQDARAEDWSHGYGTELAAFYTEVERPVTFKAWLEDLRSEAHAGGPSAEDFAA